MKEKDNKKNQYLLIPLVLILLGFAGYALFLVYRMLFTDIPVDTIKVVIVLIPVFIIGPLMGKIANNVYNKPKKDGKYTFDNNQNPNDTHSFDSNSGNNYYNHQQTPNDGFNNPNYSNSNYNNDLNNGNNFSQTPNQNPNQGGKKPFNKNLIPTIILVIVFIVFFAYQGGYLNFDSSDPVGKWIYQMNEGETVGGVTNLTDYWYMEFYENGTLDIGWKNVDYPEDSQGSGSWYVEGGVIYVTIHYNYGDTVQAEFVIKSNQLVEYGTNIPSEYYRE